MGEGTELQKAIYDKAVSSSDLVTAIAQTTGPSKGIYYDLAPDTASMPYIVYKITDKILNHNFCDYSVNAIVYFNIYDDSISSTTTIASVKDKLTDVFDRAVLTYSKKTAIGCLRTNDGEPQHTEDGWVSTVIYNIWYQ